MIASDSSAWIDFFGGKASSASQGIETALQDERLILPLPVFFELMSAPGLTHEAAQVIEKLPRLKLLEGYWQRAAELRRSVLKEGKKARGLDALIAQNCIDHKIALIAADQDFRHFVSHGLKLAK